ncbi:MAG: VOC family protein [Saprospiraceae bacterium]|nr:VOC family protein [Saprospiraceae bacterium]
MKNLLSILTLLLLLNIGFTQNNTSDINLRTFGVKINVADMDKAIDFYANKLGFLIKSKQHYPQMVILNSNSDEGDIILNKVNNLISESVSDVKTGITFQVNDLDSAIIKLKNKGVDFGNQMKRKEGVGYAISFEDPFGTRLSMMHVTIMKQEYFAEPKIYNYGILISDMDKSREYFKKLGFVERSQRYLPLDMPLGHPDKTFGFMLHYRDGVQNIHYNTSNDEHVVIIFKTNDLVSTLDKMKNAGYVFVQSKIQNGPMGKWISFRDPFGLVYDLVESK